MGMKLKAKLLGKSKQTKDGFEVKINGSLKISNKDIKQLKEFYSKSFNEFTELNIFITTTLNLYEEQKKQLKNYHLVQHFVHKKICRTWFECIGNFIWN